MNIVLYNNIWYYIINRYLLYNLSVRKVQILNEIKKATVPLFDFYMKYTFKQKNCNQIIVFNTS